MMMDVFLLLEALKQTLTGTGEVQNVTLLPAAVT